MEQWIKPKVQNWAKRIETLRRFAVCYPYTEFSGVVMSLQSQWQYLMQTVLGVREYMSLVLGGLGKQFSAKTNGTGEYFREDEETTGPSSQEGKTWDNETNRSDRLNPQDFTGVQK